MVMLNTSPTVPPYPPVWGSPVCPFSPRKMEKEMTEFMF